MQGGLNIINNKRGKKITKPKNKMESGINHLLMVCLFLHMESL